MWMGLAGADLPYCSNFGVELLFALLCFAAPQSPHRLWMGIKHQVAGAPHSETDRLGWSIHHPRQTKQIAWPRCCCRTLSIRCMGLKKRRIYTSDTHSADYIVIGIQAALPPTPVQPPVKSRDTYDSLYWDGSPCQNCRRWCSQLVWCHTSENKVASPS